MNKSLVCFINILQCIHFFIKKHHFFRNNKNLFYRILFQEITYNRRVVLSCNSISVNKIILALNCFATQQRSGSFDEDFINGLLKIAWTIVKTTNNL